jgi:hypothetical protein
MKIQLSRANLVAIIFVAISIASLTYITVEAVNYSIYWDARSVLTARVDRVHAETSPTNGSVTIFATVSATNPTDYSGMIIRNFEFRMYFVKPALNQTLFSEEILDLTSRYNPPIGYSLGPHSTVTSVLTAQLSPSRSASFNAFDQPSSAQVYGQTNVRALVDSFLDAVLGPQTVQSYQTVPIS